MRVGQSGDRAARDAGRSGAAGSGRVHDRAAVPGPGRAYALVVRQQGQVQRMVAETSDLDCATIVQRDLDDRSD